MSAVEMNYQVTNESPASAAGRALRAHRGTVKRRCAWPACGAEIEGENTIRYCGNTCNQRALRAARRGRTHSPFRGLKVG
jgi:hypothetical protein